MSANTARATEVSLPTTLGPYMPVTPGCSLSQALRARQLRINTIVVLEQIEELPLALEAAARLRVRPALGVRSRLATHHKCALARHGSQQRS